MSYAALKSNTAYIFILTRIKVLKISKIKSDHSQLIYYNYNEVGHIFIYYTKPKNNNPNKILISKVLRLTIKSKKNKDEILNFINIKLIEHLIE